jgi:hypothetical protein
MPELLQETLEPRRPSIPSQSLSISRVLPLTVTGVEEEHGSTGHLSLRRMVEEVRLGV